MSVPPGAPRSARDELREQLMSAARREDAAQRSRSPRRGRRRALGLLVAVGLAGAAAAGAADLISTGEPVKDHSFRSPRYQPAPKGAPELVAKASDPAGGTTWGVGVFTSTDGRQCAVAGQVRGLTLGLVRDGRFHPYERGTSGACGDLDRFPILTDRMTTGGKTPRTIVYGRTRAADREIVVRTGGKTFTARPGRGGGFVFVFAGKLRPDEALPELGAKLRR